MGIALFRAGAVALKRKFNTKKAMLLIGVVNVIQIGILVLLLIYSFFTSGPQPETLGISSRFFLIVITATSFINGFISIRDVFLLFRTDSQYHLLQDTFSRVESLNHSLRAQRHDFLNHLQVVFGLMEMEEYHDAREYISKVYQDIQKVSRVLKTANPAINALLQAKLLDAEKRNVQMEIHVLSQFESLPIPSWEFCRVLGNLLDNAIAALLEKNADRVLSVRLQEDLKEIIVSVEDNGPMIPEHLLDKIFHPGFTTKKEQGEGMGLAIVKEILEQYGGKITVDSSEALTAFTVSIPKIVGS